MKYSMEQGRDRVRPLAFEKWKSAAPVSDDGRYAFLTKTKLLRHQ